VRSRQEIGALPDSIRLPSPDLMLKSESIQLLVAGAQNVIARVGLVAPVGCRV
jgi:hypothetical protein